MALGTLGGLFPVNRLPKKRIPGRAAALLVLAAVIASPASALTVKLASLFPAGTAWDLSLKRMAAEWSSITDGQVRLQIYSGGVAGEEADMIRKMRIGQLDAAVLTSFGLKIIVPETFVFNLPGLLTSDDELDYVLNDVSPIFDQRFVDEGFQILAWSKSGWAYFYSKQPVLTPDDLRGMRLAVSNTEEDIAANFKQLRFNVVPIGLGELMVGLQSGMVDSFYAPPMAAAAYQWFAMSPEMLDFPIAPVVGGLVISDRTWQRIPERYHDDLKAAIQKVARDFYAESARLNAQAMTVMKQNGLQVLEPTQQQKDDWYALFRTGHALVVGDGKEISSELYDSISNDLKAFRSRQ